MILILDDKELRFDRIKTLLVAENAIICNLVRQVKLATVVIALGFSIVLAPGVATAQDSDGWQLRLTPYLWALSLDGTTAAAGSDVSVEADFGDVLDLANFAFSANMELSNGQWFVVLDDRVRWREELEQEANQVRKRDEFDFFARFTLRF